MSPPTTLLRRLAASWHGLVIPPLVLTAPAVVAAAQEPARVLTVAPGRPGATAFVSDAAGAIRIAVTTPARVEVMLLGVNGVATSARGSGNLTLAHEVSAAEVAGSRVWGVVVTSDVPTKVEVSISHPGRAYADQELAALPEVRDLAARRAAAFAALRAARPAAPVRSAATVQMMNDMARAVTSTWGPANARAIGAPVVRTGVPVRGHVLPPGVSLQHPLIPAGTLLPTAATASTTASTGTTSTTTTAPAAPAPVVPRITGITVTSLDAHGVTIVTPCENALCTIHTGDLLTISGSGFAKIAQQAHLGFITANTDIAAPATLWTDGLVIVEVPPGLHGMANQPGIIWLGAPNSPDQSSVYVFDYRQTIVTTRLSFEPSCYPPGTAILGGGSTGIIPNSTSQGFILGDPAVFARALSGNLFSGGSGDDVLLPGVTLRNGWLVDHVAFGRNQDGTTGSDATLVEQHPSTPNAQVGIHWWFNGTSSVSYDVSIFVTGEANTSPYADGYPSGPLPCVP